MGLINGRETENGYQPSLLHTWLKPKISGNVINGLGESEDRPATPIYHRMEDSSRPWFKVNIFFLIKQAWDVFAENGQGRAIKRDLKNKAEEGRRRDDIAAHQVDASPPEWTQKVRAFAKECDFVDLVGITKVHENLYFDEDLAKEDRMLSHAVVLLRCMDYDNLSDSLKEEEWQKVPFWKRKWVRPNREVMNTYADLHDDAIKLSTWMRAQGYPSEALGGAPGSKINMLRTAIEAGLGELGNHGSIINETYGSGVRFAVVLTDMPLVTDERADFGADAFCHSCQICTNACPPKAITNEKVLVRGIEKWYVDFDKCIPYFNDTLGCGICITACPFSRPGVGTNLVKKLARKRAKAEAASAKVSAG